LELCIEPYQGFYPELEEAAEWVVGCTIWMTEEAMATVTDKFNHI
jgi:hypothetical protein